MAIGVALAAAGLLPAASAQAWAGPVTTLTGTAIPSVAVVGQPVTFSFTETNTSPTETVTGIALFGSICSPTGPTSLGPGASAAYACTQTFSAPGRYTNRVVALGRVDGERAFPEYAVATVRVVGPTTLSVSATPSQGPAPLTVTFTITEQNNTALPITNVNLVGTYCSPGGPFAIPPSTTLVTTCTHTFAAPGIYVNRVVATGQSDSVILPPESAFTLVRVTR